MPRQATPPARAPTPPAARDPTPPPAKAPLSPRSATARDLDDIVASLMRPPSPAGQQRRQNEVQQYIDDMEAKNVAERLRLDEQKREIEVAETFFDISQIHL